MTLPTNARSTTSTTIGTWRRWNLDGKGMMSGCRSLEIDLLRASFIRVHTRARTECNRSCPTVHQHEAVQHRSVGSPLIAELMALACYDFLVVNLDHYHIDASGALFMMQAARAAGVPALLIVVSNREDLINKTMRMGHNGGQTNIRTFILIFIIVGTARFASQYIS